jgi:hypothetical protein
MNQTSGNGRGRIHWGRADIDGLPFRGSITPNMTTEEFEARLTRVADAKVDVFDMADIEQRKRYTEILDKIANGWAQCIGRDRQFSEAKGTWLVIIEWVEMYMEDGAPTGATAGGNT